MNAIHFIQHNAWVGPGEYLVWAQRSGYEASVTRCWLYEPFPEEAAADLLVILGGYQRPSTTKEECPYFDAEAEMTFIRRYVEAGKAVVGVCLGAQLLGETLGGAFGRSPEQEIGPVQARLTEAGRQDPFLQQFPDTFLAGEWHADMPGLTDEAVILAESDGCPRQIVRYGKHIYGFQTHLEFTHEIMEQLVRKAGDSLPAGERFVQSAEELLFFDYAEMNGLLDSFLDRLMTDWRGMQQG